MNQIQSIGREAELEEQRCWRRKVGWRHWLSEEGRSVLACGAAWCQWMCLSRTMGDPVQLCYQVPRPESSHSSGLRTVDRDRCICTMGIVEKEW